MPRRQHAGGFTLVELLTVMAIIGVLIGVLGFMLLRWLRQSEVRDAAAQVVSDLRQSRSDAQRLGQPVSVALAGGGEAYAVRRGGGGAQTRALPSRVRLEPVLGTARAVAYTPPFGTLNTAGVVWRVQSPTPSVYLYVKVAGITGKVMVSGTAE